MAVLFTVNDTFQDALFNSTDYIVTPEGFPQGNKAVDATWFAEYFYSFIGNGVFPNPSTNYQVSAATGMNVRIHPGKAWARGYFCYDTEEHVAKITADTVAHDYYFVLRLDTGTGEFKPRWYTDPNVLSVPARSPAIHELLIAKISVPAGAQAITDSMITDYRTDPNMCGIVAAVIDNIDTSTLAQQLYAYLSDLSDFIGVKEQEIITWQTTSKQQFDDWFAGIKGQMSGDVATKLENSKANRYYAVCNTAEATYIKSVSTTGYTLNTGQYVAVKFTNRVQAGSTLKIENTPSLTIVSRAGNALADDEINAGDTALFIYNGSNYTLLNSVPATDTSQYLNINLLEVLPYMKFYQEFTSSGTFNVPATGKYCVIAVGGGSSGFFINSDARGIGGIAGELKLGVFDLTAGQNIAVTIGNGGAKTTTNNTSNPGSSTSFGALLTALGGTITDTPTVFYINGADGIVIPPKVPGGNGGYDRTKYGGQGAREILSGGKLTADIWNLLNAISPPTGNGGAIGATGEGYGAGGAGQGGVGRSGIVIIYRM